jgi:hypothetical protein
MTFIVSVKVDGIGRRCQADRKMGSFALGGQMG